MPPRPLTVLCCGSAVEQIAPLARALANGGVRSLAALPPGRRRAGEVIVVPAAPQGDAAVRRWLGEMWVRARRVDALVICPTISAAGAAGDPAAVVWQASLDAGLKSTFLLAKHAFRRLRRAGGGTLIVVHAPPSRAGGPALVVSAGLQCLVDALTKAAPRGVRVALATVAPRRSTARPTARSMASLARVIRVLAEQGGHAVIGLDDQP